MDTIEVTESADTCVALSKLSSPELYVELPKEASDASSGTSTYSSRDDNFKRITDNAMIYTAKTTIVHLNQLLILINEYECSCCDFMPTSLEFICCTEIDRTVKKITFS